MATQARVSEPAGLADVSLTPFAPGLGLPLFIQPETSQLAQDADHFRGWFRDNEAAIDALLYEAGALVFRGFPVRDAQGFSALIDHYESPPLAYTGGSAGRGELATRVFEATNAPARLQIALHQEMAYLPNYPDRLSFFCRMPSVTRGETILGDMRRVTAELDSALVRKVDERGVLYTRNLRDRRQTTGDAYFDAIHRTWQDAFNTEDPAKPVEDAANMGLGAEWLDDGSLNVTYRGPGLLNHPKTGERLWFNQLQTMNLGPHNTPSFETYEAQYGATGRYPFKAAFGDCSPVSPADAQALADTLDACTVAFPWSSGDVMLVDNYRCAHGRNPFTGLRDVQVALLNH